MPDSADYPFAELDAELHECALPKPQRGRTHICACGCIWAVIPVGWRGRMRWALTRDPDAADKRAGA